MLRPHGHALTDRAGPPSQGVSSYNALRGVVEGRTLFFLFFFLNSLFGKGPRAAGAPPPTYAFVTTLIFLVTFFIFVLGPAYGGVYETK